MKKVKFLSLILIGILILSGCSQDIEVKENIAYIVEESNKQSLDSINIPEYSGKPYTIINNNIPFFTGEEDTLHSYENYSELDELGRSGVAFANIGMDLMPTEDRESISEIKPSGWKSIKYDNVDGKYLYNRCHLIGFQLTSENANEKNLITGTRYMNVNGMLPFENMIADYIKETNHHVLYRVTPIFKGSNLVASGVLMEAKSVEDDEILFNVFVFNVQPGIEIDYATGNSYEKETIQNEELNIEENVGIYILNTNTKKIHNPDCSSVKKMNESNKKQFSGKIESLISEGYEFCKICN